MHNIQYDYDPEDLPGMNDIVICKFPVFHDAKNQDLKFIVQFIQKQGEIIIQIKCSDGIIFILRRDYHTQKPGEE